MYRKKIRNLSFSGEDGVSCADEFALVKSVGLVLVVFVGDGGSVASASKLLSYSLLRLLLVPFNNLVLGSFVICSSSGSSLHSSESSSSSSISLLSSGDSSNGSSEPSFGNGGNGRSVILFSELLFTNISWSFSFAGTLGSGFCSQKWSKRNSLLQFLNRKVKCTALWSHCVHCSPVTVSVGMLFVVAVTAVPIQSYCPPSQSWEPHHNRRRSVEST